MKICFLLLFTLLLSVSVFGQSKTIEQLQSQVKTFKKSGKYRITYNKSKDKTIVQTKDYLLTCFNVSAAFSFPGKEMKEQPDIIVLTFTHILGRNCSTGWQGIKELQAGVIADGRRIWLGRSERDNYKFSSDFFGEVNSKDQLFYRMTIEVFEELSKAEKVSVRVNTDVDTFDSGLLRILKDFYELTEISGES